MPAFAESKRAFVVGIDAYPNLSAEAQLGRAAADVSAVGDALTSVGFQVTRVTSHATLETILRTMQAFKTSIEPGDTVLLYFTGHSISLDDGNYLVPSDIPNLQVNDDLIAKRLAIPEHDFSQGIRNAGARFVIVVVDAFRNNPFPRSGTHVLGGAAQGLARPHPVEDAFTLYSAREGQTALDRLSGNDLDANSVFARAFIKALKTPGINVSEFGDRVRDEVATLARSDGHQQIPAVFNDLLGARSVFLGSNSPTTLPSKGSMSDEAEWSLISGTTDQSLILKFVDRFPTSALQAKARARLEELQRKQSATASKTEQCPPSIATGALNKGPEVSALSKDSERPAKSPSSALGPAMGAWRSDVGARIRAKFSGDGEAGRATVTFRVSPNGLISIGAVSGAGTVAVAGVIAIRGVRTVSPPPDGRVQVLSQTFSIR